MKTEQRIFQSQSSDVYGVLLNCCGDSLVRMLFDGYLDRSQGCIGRKPMQHNLRSEIKTLPR
jgi:hypothetical protein